MTASRMRDGIIRRGRGWAFVLDLPPDPATGKRRQKWVGGFRTRTDAQRARNEARAKADRGAWRAPGRLTVGGYLGEVWLPAIPAKVAVSTLVSYRQNLAKVAACIGHVRLADLDPPTLDALYADLEASGLARSTVRLIHTQLHRALADAVRWDLLSRNPAALVDPPKPPRRTATVWTATQLRTFLVGVADDRLTALYQLAATTGMRLGEVVALGWVDLHLDDEYLTVRRAKTAAGRRRVELDPARSPRCGRTASGRQPSGSRSAPAGATTAWCSPGRAASRSTQTRSYSRSSDERPGSACR